MTAQPTYPLYQESGLPWAPKVPQGWNVLRNGRLFAHRVQTGFPMLPILEVSLRTGVRVRDMENLKRKQVMSQKEKYKRAAKGDIAYNMMRMWQGALGPAPVDGLVSPAYVVVKPFEETNSAYYSYLFRTDAYMREVNKFSRGIVADRNRLYWDEFKQMPSLVPPRTEQNQIVVYLRAQDVHIARLIKAKRELIGLLTEQKLRIIDRAVTRGLDASVALKPSGIAWLGDVPEHWDVLRIKNVVRESDERTSTGAEKLLSLSRHHGLVPFESLSSRPPSAKDFLKYKLCRPGQLVMNRMQAWSGLFANAERVGLISPDYSVFHVSDQTGSDFLALLFKTKKYVTQFAISSTGIGTGFNRLYTPQFGAISLALPPLEEQKAICASVSSECMSLDETIQRAEEEIKLIREYRDRQIADVVTGQIDVRSWVPEADDVGADEELAALGDDEELDTDGEEDDVDD